MSSRTISRKRWHQKNKLSTQSLENASVVEIENTSYKHYVSEKRETEATEQRHEIVKKLLARLPESERTVVTLHYLGEMPIKEIGRFLGVSANTINSRLRRARKRLQEREELLIQEVLGSVQLPANLMENIGRQVTNINPTSPPVGKPLVPWAAIGTAAVLAVLAFGTGNRYLDHFQQPYSFEAQAEPTIEIVDARIVLDIDAKPALRNPIERTIIPRQDNSTNISVDIEIPDLHTSEAQFLTLALAQKTPSQDAAEDTLDFKELLAAIKYHHALHKSGEGEIIHTDEQPPVEADTRIVKSRIAFDSENTRFDSQREITILTPTEMWQIAPHRRRHPKYHFSTEPRSIYESVDPRRWLFDLARHLERENFQITGREIFNDIPCYVLEAKDGDTSEKIWTRTPNKGFNT